MPRPAKRAKLLDNVLSGSESEDNGVRLTDAGFTINADFAKRFEHNKKREEKSRLEEKFKSAKGKRARDDEEDEESSSDESEDDNAELADESLDAEIQDVLQAIKSKDPRVRDPNAKFYRDFEAEAAAAVAVAANGGMAKKEKPMYLHDYHRQNMLSGHTGAEEDDEPVQTYQQEQDALKRELVGSMHATGEAIEAAESDEEEDFMVAKSKPKHDALPTASKPKQITNQDVAAADKDPESYLSNFMAARGWLPKDNSSRFQAFDSDDSDEERRADEFEEAYNMRFEDPKKANEKLQSFARDVGKHGVRRDEKSGRAKARERERELKEAEKREREEDKARLRKLKIEEAEEKVKRIKEAAGLRGKDVDLKQWRDIIEGDFEDDEWDREMQRRFGEHYYAEHEGGGEDSDEEMDDAAGKKSKKAKKPTWDDDIDIKDLLPDFIDDKEAKPELTLSDDEDEADGGAPLPVEAEDQGGEEAEEEEHLTKKRSKTKRDRLQEKADAKRAARKQRMAIEEIVDASLPLSHPAITTSKASASNKAPAAGFRYRETSPTTFGMSARDILFADDSKLNEFVGLKKMAAWRDEEKKRRDRKKFSKKARLRQWRKETFGKGEEPEGGFEKVLGGGVEEMEVDGATGGRNATGGEGESGVREGERKKKKRSKKRKTVDAGVEV